MSGRAILGRLPELDRISIGVLHAGEAAVGIRLLVDLDRDARLAQLLDHGVQIAHAEVEHPRLLLAAEVVGIGREGLEHRWAGFLAPGLLVVARRREVDAEVVAVPRLERARVARGRRSRRCRSLFPCVPPLLAGAQALQPNSGPSSWRTSHSMSKSSPCTFRKRSVSSIASAFDFASRTA